MPELVLKLLAPIEPNPGRTFTLDGSPVEGSVGLYRVLTLEEAALEIAVSADEPGIRYAEYGGGDPT